MPTLIPPVRLAGLAAGLLFLPALAVGQQPSLEFIPVPDRLVAESVPPLPASLVGQVRRYTESRSAQLYGWHPLRREMVIGTRFGNTAQLHRVTSPGGARTQLTFFDEPAGAASYEPVRGEFVVFSRDEGGDEFSQLFRLDLANGVVTRLTDGGRSQNGGVRWSPTGRLIAYGSTRRNGADRDIWVVDPRDPTSSRLVTEVKGGGWSVADWSPDGSRLLLREYLSIQNSRYWLVTVDGGVREQVTPPDTTDVAWSGGRFTPDGRSIYFTTDRQSEFPQLVRFDLQSRATEQVMPSLTWGVEQFDLSRNGRFLALVSNEAGRSVLYLYDVSTQKRLAVGPLPAGVIGGLEWHPNSKELGFTLSSARSPSDVYSVDVATRTITRWTSSELGGLVAEQLVEPELVKWKSFDGLEISGFLYRPPAEFTGRRPVIINIHGGPESQARPGFLGRNNYWLNELGVALIYPNVRGSSGYGKNFVSLDNGVKREDSVRDIGALLDWIRAQPGLDAGRVMVTGGSYGGYMTLMVATTYPDRIAAAVDVVGISHLATFLAHTESYRRDLRRAEYGDERDPATRAFMDRTAALANAQRITKPLFVVQGANDPRVPRTEADQIVRSVREHGGMAWYLVGLNEGHGFRKKDNADFQFFATIEFVRRYLMGEGGSAVP
jgi:dipeptidyl aminopeptidase/acylaminoacyl peptidase